MIAQPQPQPQPQQVQQQPQPQPVARTTSAVVESRRRAREDASDMR
jgi:hypothetical protein